MQNTALNIIQKFGGINACARALGHRNASTVQGWRERGVIPAARQAEILKAARREKIVLTPADFGLYFYSEPTAA